MLIPVWAISFFWSVKKPLRVLHVGAHEAEELPQYLAHGWGAKETVWVEAIPEQAEIVRQKVAALPEHRVEETVAWSESGREVSFNVTNNVQSSSVLNLGEHLQVHPDVVVVRTISLKTTSLSEIDFWSGERNVFLNLDIQGAELEALRGIGDCLEECVAIYTEVNTRPLYEGVPLLKDLDSFLDSYGFSRADWSINKNYGWGDALYLRRSGSLGMGFYLRRLARRLVHSFYRASLFQHYGRAWSGR